MIKLFVFFAFFITNTNAESVFTDSCKKTNNQSPITLMETGQECEFTKLSESRIKAVEGIPEEIKLLDKRILERFGKTFFDDEPNRVQFLKTMESDEENKVYRTCKDLVEKHLLLRSQMTKAILTGLETIKLSQSELVASCEKTRRYVHAVKKKEVLINGHRACTNAPTSKDCFDFLKMKTVQKRDEFERDATAKVVEKNNISYTDAEANRLIEMLQRDQCVKNANGNSEQTKKCDEYEKTFEFHERCHSCFSDSQTMLKRCLNLQQHDFDHYVSREVAVAAIKNTCHLFSDDATYSNCIAKQNAIVSIRAKSGFVCACDQFAVKELYEMCFAQYSAEETTRCHDHTNGVDVLSKDYQSSTQK